MSPRGPSSSPPTLSPVLGLQTELLDRFHHFVAPTVPHLIALLCYPSPGFPPDGTSLIVIDDVSSSFDITPSNPIHSGRGNNQTPQKKSEIVQWAASRRWSSIEDVSNRLSKLAATTNIALLLLSQTSTKVKIDTAAVIGPAITTKAWIENVKTRIVLYQDFMLGPEGISSQSNGFKSRFMGVVKLNGLNFDIVNKTVQFRIGKVSLLYVCIAFGRTNECSPGSFQEKQAQLQKSWRCIPAF